MKEEKYNLIFFPTECGLRSIYSCLAIKKHKYLSKIFSPFLINYSPRFRKDYEFLIKEHEDIDSNIYFSDHLESYNISEKDALDRIVSIEKKYKIDLKRSISVERHSKLIKYPFQYILKCWDFCKVIHDKFKNIVFLYYTTEHLHDYILSLYCKLNKIDFYLLHEFHDHEFISPHLNNIKGIPYLMMKDYKNFLEKEEIEYNKEYADNYFSNTISPLLLENKIIRGSKKRVLNQILFIIKNFSSSILNYKEINKNTYLDIIRDQSFYDRRNSIRGINRLFTALFIKFHNINELNVPFFFYPLNYQPEQSTNLWNTKFLDQVNLIKEISKLLPNNTKLLVKDHFRHQGYRDFRDYLRLKSLNNVILVNPNISALDLARKSIGTISTHGSIIQECFLNKLPIVMLGNHYFGEISKSLKCNSLNDLKKVLEEKKFFIASEDELRKYKVRFQNNLLISPVGLIPGQQKGQEIINRYYEYALSTMLNFTRVFHLNNKIYDESKNNYIDEVIKLTKRLRNTNRMKTHIYSNSKNMKRRKILIYGCGEVGKRFLKYSSNKDEIIGFTAQNFGEFRSFENRPVYNPQEILNLDFDYIVIASSFEEEIFHELVTNIGLDEKKILLCTRKLIYPGKSLNYFLPFLILVLPFLLVILFILFIT